MSLIPDLPKLEKSCRTAFQTICDLMSENMPDDFDDEEYGDTVRAYADSISREMEEAKKDVESALAVLHAVDEGREPGSKLFATVEKLRGAFDSVDYHLGDNLPDGDPEMYQMAVAKMERAERKAYAAFQRLAAIALQ